jgi:ubiquinone/menaquinone biosynthesis C-methylase UbiE
VIHHARIEDIRKAIKEIQRVLKPRGLIFITVRKRIPKKRRLKFKKLDSRTYIPVEGDEKGLIHYLFNKRLLRKEFKNFEIHDIWVDLENYYCLLGELSARVFVLPNPYDRFWS